MGGEPVIHTCTVCHQCPMTMEKHILYYNIIIQTQIKDRTRALCVYVCTMHVALCTVITSCGHAREGVASDVHARHENQLFLIPGSSGELELGRSVSYHTVGHVSLAVSLPHPPSIHQTSTLPLFLNANQSRSQAGLVETHYEK